MPSLLNPTPEEILMAGLDITHPKGPVEVKIADKADGTQVLWVNVEGICVLRICQTNFIVELPEPHIPEPDDPLEIS